MILERPEEPGKKYALAFTIVVHGLLVLVLFLGVQWKRSPPKVYEVELWSARPVVAVQPAPAPSPVSEPEPKQQPKPEPKPEPKLQPKVEAPKQPDIAIKDDKKKPEPKKPEPKKPEPPKPEPKKPEPKSEPKKPEPPKPEPKAPPKFDFSKELASESTAVNKVKSSAAAQQQLANAAAAESELRAAANKRGLADYAAKIRSKVRGNIMLPPNLHGNPEAVFMVDQLPGGEVLEVRLKRTSGNSSLDAAIERAIRKSSPLPKPDNPALFERTLEIKYRPFEE